MKRKIPAPLPHAAETRALAATRTSGGHALRAVLLAAVAGGLGGCDPASPGTWPAAAMNGAHQLGVWLHVVEPYRTAGEMPAVAPVPVAASASASAAPSTSPSSE